MAHRKTKRRFWSEVDLELLRRNFADSHTADLASVLNRKPAQVLAKANSMGLHKCRDFIAEVARQRSAVPGHGGVATRFKPGLVPANKGLRRPGFAPGNMARTQFKPGSRPHTWVPVGSFTVIDGTLEQKLNDDPRPKNVRWKAYHRIVWERANGPVPAGHVVAFKPGRKSLDPELITLDAVELITRKQLALRNSIHNLPGELAEVCRLRGSLKRAITQRQKDKDPS